MEEISGLTHLLQLIRSKEILVVKFYADWCGACRVVERQYELMHQGRHARATFGKCNIDACRDCTQHFQVESVPTFIIWYRGQKRAVVKGARLDSVDSTIVDLVREAELRGGRAAPPVLQQSRVPAGKLHVVLVQKMSLLGRVIASSPVDESMMAEACEAICSLLEKDHADRSLGALLLPYFVSKGFSAATVDALFAYISRKSGPHCGDGEYIVHGLVGHLIEFFLSLTLFDTNELKIMRQAFRAMIMCPSLLSIIVRSHLFYSDSIGDGLQLEYGTVLGAMLGVCLFSRTARLSPPYLRSMEVTHLMKMFPSDVNDHSRKVSELQLYMEGSCEENKGIVLALLENKVSRLPTLQFLGAALRLNAGHTKTMNAHLLLSSRFFMCQLNDVITEIALPLLKKPCNTSTFPPSYVLEDLGGDTVVDFGEDVERIAHFGSERDLPLFQPPQAPFKPSVHIFFLAARSLALSAGALIEAREQLERDSMHPNLSPEQRAHCIAEKLLIESLVGSEVLGQKRVRLLNGVAGWLLNVMGVSEDGTLAPSPPEPWEYLPQQLVDVVICGVQLVSLQYYDIGNIISLMLVLMGNTTYFPKPHTHGLFPAFLLQLLQGAETKRALMEHRWFTQNIIRSCVCCYIAVEKSTFERVTVRYTLSHCIKSFLVLESLCQPVREEFEADGTLLERFSHMVTAEVNEATDQLIETLTQMNALVRAGADTSENPISHSNGNGEGDGRGAERRAPSGGGVATHERAGSTEGSSDDEGGGSESNDVAEAPSVTYHSLGQSLEKQIRLFEASMDMFIQFASSFPKGVAQNMVAQQISQMLARNITSFVGAESKKLKIENPDRYNFRPREILGRLIDCLVQFANVDNFLRYLCSCGVPLEGILRSISIIVDRGLAGEQHTWKLKSISGYLKEIAEDVRKDEMLWDDAPEYALDALLSTPLLHPVALPSDVKDLNDLVYTNADTIHHLLLSESKHPFTKEYLDEAMVKEFNSREDVKHARERLQERIDTWLKGARLSRR
uniref:Uncharacterized protein TCIL3000_6_1960 n=1 Tax=Trypanosoma congolense (strain IL3000) TaxID=1068625 RepID=G0UNK1_TRYCI|nr:unnamed protein product [Trypanosoma congolense IL3000]